MALALSVPGHSSAGRLPDIQTTVAYLNDLAREEFNDDHKLLWFGYNYASDVVAIRLSHQQPAFKSELVYEISPSVWTTGSGQTRFEAAEVDWDADSVRMLCGYAGFGANSSCIRSRYTRWQDAKRWMTKTALAEKEYFNHLAVRSRQPSANVRLTNALNHLFRLSREQHQARALGDPFL